MAGTVTRYQCEFCGAYVTWRNTGDGRRAFRESNRRHDYQLRPVGDDYHGRHRLEDGGVRPATFLAWDLWWSLPSQNRAPLIIDDVEGIADDVPEYTASAWLGTTSGAPYWIDGMLVFPYQRALPPPTARRVVDLPDVVDPEFEAWLRSVTPPPYP